MPVSSLSFPRGVGVKMWSGSSRSLVISTLVFLVLLTIAFVGTPFRFAEAVTPGVCGDAAVQALPTEINVAVLVFVDSDELLLTRPLSSYAHVPVNSSGFGGVGTIALQPFYLGVDFYVKQLAAFDNKLPVLGGSHHVVLNISYVNLGRVDWNRIAGGYPTDAIASITNANKPGGLFDRLAYNSSTILGGNKTFTFFIANPMMSTFVYGLVNRLEDNLGGIVIHPLLVSSEAYVCDGVASSQSLTPDCLSSTYGRRRLDGARRFETLFSVMPDVSADATTTLNLFHTLGVKTIAIFRDALITGKSYNRNVFDSALITAEELNLHVVLADGLDVADGIQCPSSGLRGNNCPPLDIFASQNQVWPNGTTGIDWARRLQLLNPDAVVFIAGTGSPGCWSFGQLVRGMQSVDWTPKMLSWVGAFEKTSMASFLKNGKEDMLHTTGEIVWHRSLRGASFQTKRTSTNFELIEANSTHAAPAVFVDRFDQLYGPDCRADLCVAPAAPGGHPHPFWKGNIDGGTIPALSFNALVQVQKLVEVSVSSNVRTILNAASKIDTPSIFHRLGFDSHGRAKQFDVPVTQYNGVGVTDDTTILVPFNIGSPPVFPMPKWSERVFSPQWFSMPSEKAMVAVNSLCIGIVLVLSYLVWKHSGHPIIRATTASFSGLIASGSVLMLISNFFNSMHTNDAHCAAQAWTLTLGFTLMFSSLFVKTHRIWSIFDPKAKLQVRRVVDWDLVKVVLVFVGIDILLNSIWQGVGGMQSVLVVDDPLRPAKNYFKCEYAPVSLGFVYTHVAIKGMCLFVGIALTYGIRHVPSNFNDSSVLAVCIYNVSFVVCFVIPIVVQGLGGREATYMIRNYAIMFVSMVTYMLLYAPKLYLIKYGTQKAIQAALLAGGGNNVTQMGSDDASSLDMKEEVNPSSHQISNKVSKKDRHLFNNKVTKPDQYLAEKQQGSPHVSIGVHSSPTVDLPTTTDGVASNGLPFTKGDKSSPSVAPVGMSVGRNVTDGSGSLFVLTHTKHISSSSPITPKTPQQYRETPVIATLAEANESRSHSNYPLDQLHQPPSPNQTPLPLP